MSVALVTGASGALGGAIARTLAAIGWHVLAQANRSWESAEALVAGIGADGGSAEVLYLDVTDGQACETALNARVQALGPVQVVVNNAGIHDDVPMAGMAARQWHEVVDVSLNGFYHITQPLLMPMMRTRWGRIISVSSVAARLGNRGQVNYAAAKAGLHGATRSLSREIASRGITVNAVAPGIIASPLTEGLFDRQRLRQTVPAARMGRPEEVAALVAFLASDSAGYISGQIIGIDGGMT